MQKQEYEIMLKELEPFMTEQKIERKDKPIVIKKLLMVEGENKWLELKKVIRIGKGGEKILLMDNYRTKYLEYMQRLQDFYIFNRYSTSKETTKEIKTEPEKANDKEWLPKDW